ncbi:MAG: hypothetical protein U0Q15_03315 [Kineosporiaceae bacterium]
MTTTTTRTTDLTLPVISVVADQVLTPSGPEDLETWARGALMFWHVADGLDLHTRLAHARGSGRPAPLLLAYGKGSDVVRFAAPIIGLTRVLPPLWTFVCDDVREDLLGQVVTVDGEPVVRQQGVAYASPAGPGRDGFVRSLLRG